MESKVEKLLKRAANVVDNGDNEIDTSLVRDLAAVVREYHPIVNPPTPLVENPNIVAWRSQVIQGLNHAIATLKTTLKTDRITATTNIRRSVMKDGGIKARLGIKFKAHAVYDRNVDPRKIIQRIINVHMEAANLPPVILTTTSGSQMDFSARVYIQGDANYDHYAKYWL